MRTPMMAGREKKAAQSGPVLFGRAGAGFTLVELILAMAILSILAAVAINTFTSIRSSTSVGRDVNNMAAFLQKTRLAAFAQKNQVIITVGSNALTTSPNVGSLGLENGFTGSSATFTINTRGMFNTTGNIRLTAANPGAAADCVVISQTRIRQGLWSGTSCTAQ